MTLRFPPCAWLAVVCVAALCTVPVRGRVFSNTAVVWPHGHVMGDFDGDGRDDYGVISGKFFFAAQCSVGANGKAAGDHGKAIRRGFAGRFLDGKFVDRDLFCLIDAVHDMQCYRLHRKQHKKLKTRADVWAKAGNKVGGGVFGPDVEVLTGQFLPEQPDAIVLFNTTSGALAAYKLVDGKTWTEVAAGELDFGKLNDTEVREKLAKSQLRAADVAGDGLTDLMFVDDKGVAAVFKNVEENGKRVFKSPKKEQTSPLLKNPDDQLLLANVRGANREEAVVVSPSTGTYSVYFGSESPEGWFVWYGIDKSTSKLELPKADSFKPVIPGKTNKVTLYFAQFARSAKIEVAQKKSGKSSSRKKKYLAQKVARDDIIFYDHTVKGGERFVTFIAYENGKDNVLRYHHWFSQSVLKPSEDQDGDALTTFFELGGKIGVPLHHYGASPFAKDIFLELDYMKSRTKSQKLSDTALNLVKRELAAYGINMHTFQEQAIPFKPSLGSTANPFSWDSQEWKNLESTYFTPQRRGLFRYAVAAYRYTRSHNRSSGVGQLPGRSFLITLSDNRSTKKWAGTLLHEMGHTLGLYHGGRRYRRSEDDASNYKVNHPSVMNYNYQMKGIKYGGARRLFYSNVNCKTLYETRLNESAGVVCRGKHAGQYEVLLSKDRPGYTGRRSPKWVKLNEPVDFNRNGKKHDQSIRWDINSDGDTKHLRATKNEYAEMMNFRGDVRKADRQVGNAVVQNAFVRMPPPSPYSAHYSYHKFLQQSRTQQQQQSESSRFRRLPNRDSALRSSQLRRSISPPWQGAGARNTGRSTLGNSLLTDMSDVVSAVMTLPPVRSRAFLAKLAEDAANEEETTKEPDMPEEDANQSDASDDDDGDRNLRRPATPISALPEPLIAKNSPLGTTELVTGVLPDSTKFGVKTAAEPNEQVLEETQRDSSVFAHVFHSTELNENGMISISSEFFTDAQLRLSNAQEAAKLRLPALAMFEPKDANDVIDLDSSGSSSSSSSRHQVAGGRINDPFDGLGVGI
eukprot:TRINITY_DN65948_c6_g4_i3.p1 TRINITY_DN65948_c6_g4~~TRINITY_DN65948_c6_g4_i3.p1  ORF type:complete len:1023 (+),score=570.33 TRINITY_DN65948_c6_g4_i3:55-3123(+)